MSVWCFEINNKKKNLTLKTSSLRFTLNMFLRSVFYIIAEEPEFSCYAIVMPWSHESCSARV